MKNVKRIFIVGQIGAGKAVLGKAIAEKLGYAFYDADFGLSGSIGRTHEEILGKDGTQSFLKCQSDMLKHFLTKENIVVTTDELLVSDKKNRELLSSEFTVYLDVSQNIQYDRIKYNRPLHQVDNYENFMADLRKGQDPLYEEVASFSLSSDDGELDMHVDNVIKAMQA